MKRYKNCSGISGVLEYDFGPDFITVKFIDGETYRYTYACPGKLFVERMKKLATAGEGLSTYISQTVRDRYESKL